jgi:hypothetical protein
VVWNRRFGTSYRSYLQGSRCPRWWEPIGNPETSVSNDLTPSNNPGDGRTITPHVSLNYLQNYFMNSTNQVSLFCISAPTLLLNVPPQHQSNCCMKYPAILQLNTPNSSRVTSLQKLHWVNIRNTNQITIKVKLTLEQPMTIREE